MGKHRKYRTAKKSSSSSSSSTSSFALCEHSCKHKKCCPPPITPLYCGQCCPGGGGGGGGGNANGLIFSLNTKIVTTSSIPRDNNFQYMLAPAPSVPGREQTLDYSSGGSVPNGTYKRLIRSLGSALDTIDLLPSGPFGNTYVILPDPDNTDKWYVGGQFPYVGSQTAPVEAISWCSMTYNSSTQKFLFAAAHDNTSLFQTNLSNLVTYPTILSAVNVPTTSLTYVAGAFSVVSVQNANIAVWDRSVVPTSSTFSALTIQVSGGPPSETLTTDQQVTQIALDSGESSLVFIGLFSSIASYTAPPTKLQSIAFLDLTSSPFQLITDVSIDGTVNGVLVDTTTSPGNNIVWLYGGFDNPASLTPVLAPNAGTSYLIRWVYAVGSSPASGSWQPIIVTNTLDGDVKSAVIEGDYLFFTGKFSTFGGFAKYRLDGSVNQFESVTEAVPRNVFTNDYMVLFNSRPNEILAAPYLGRSAQYSLSNSLYRVTNPSSSVPSVDNFHLSVNIVGAALWANSVSGGSYLLGVNRSTGRDILAVTHGYTNTRGLVRFTPTRLSSVVFASSALLRGPDDVEYNTIRFVNDGSNVEIIYSTIHNCWVLLTQSAGVYLEP